VREEVGAIVPDDEYNAEKDQNDPKWPFMIYCGQALG